jgi:crotonobetainyl-CoA:carnitine CoA-transferase CaiB-like acyl-CoA transferase
MLLADMGADVIKVEQPGFQSELVNQRPVVDRNKKSIALNLKIKEAQEVLYKLVERTDVLVEGFRPGVAERLSIDYESVRKINSEIIYCSVTGYGQNGPYKDLPGHDPNYLAMSGVLGITGTEGGEHVLPGIPIADLNGGMHAAFSIVCALWAREKTGFGQRIDVSITDAMASWLGVSRGDTYFRTGRAFRRGERPSNVYTTKDERFICVAPLEQHFWERFCVALEIEEYIPYRHEVLIYAPPFPKKRGEILSRLTKIFRMRKRDEWIDLLRKEDIPVSPVYTLEEAFRDPHLLHRNMVVEVQDPDGGSIKQAGIAVKLSGTPGKIGSVAPLPGENAAEILASLGYDEAEIEELRGKGAIGLT